MLGLKLNHVSKRGHLWPVRILKLAFYPRFASEVLQFSVLSEWPTKFNDLSGDVGQRGPYSPYKLSYLLLYMWQNMIFISFFIITIHKRCEMNCAEHSTFDAIASRHVACCVQWSKCAVWAWSTMLWLCYSLCRTTIHQAIPGSLGGTLCVSDTGDDLASLIRTHLKVTLRHRNEKCVTSYQSKQLSQQTTPECVMWLPTLSAPRWLDCFTLLLVRHLADVSCFLAKDVEQTTRWSKVKLLHC